MSLPPSRARLPVVFLAVLLTACQTTRMAAEWTNKDYAGTTLRGQRILVLCQAPDPTVQRLCEDQLVSTANSWGTIAVRPEARAADAPATESSPQDWYRDMAKAASATAVLSMTLMVDATVANPGPVFGIGVGGGSWGGGGWGRGGGSFGGVGTSVGIPMGPGSVQQGFAASTEVVDAARGQVIWSGRAVAPPTQAFIRQLIDLTQVTFESMQKAGVL